MWYNGSERVLGKATTTNHEHARVYTCDFFCGATVDDGGNLIRRPFELGAEAIGFWIVMLALDHVAGGVVCLVW